MKHIHRRSARTMVRAAFLLLPFVLAGGALALSLSLAAAVPPAQDLIQMRVGRDVLFPSPTPRHSQAVAWGDVDGDGDLDLAVGNGIFPSAISWLDLEQYNPVSYTHLDHHRCH